MGLKVLDDDPTIILRLAEQLASGVDISVEKFRQQRIAERQSVRKQDATGNVGSSGALSKWLDEEDRQLGLLRSVSE